MAAVSQQNKETDRRAVATSRYSIRERSESRATIETDSRAEIATDKKRGVPRLLHWLAAVGGAGILYGLFRLIKLFKIF